MVTSETRTEDRFERTGASIAAARPDLLAHVSTAQQRVLELLLAGLTEPPLAERIGRSRHTVHAHTKAIYAALRVSNRVQLVLLFSQPAAAPAKPAAVVEAQPARAARLATVIPPTGAMNN